MLRDKAIQLLARREHSRRELFAKLTLWQENAIAVRIKRFGKNIPKPAQQRLQQARFLQQRGFTADQIRAAFVHS